MKLVSGFLLLFANRRAGWCATARARQWVFFGTRDAGSEWGGRTLSAVLTMARAAISRSTTSEWPLQVAV